MCFRIIRKQIKKEEGKRSNSLGIQKYPRHANTEEIIVENFPNMGKEIVNQVQEAQRVPYRINPRRNTPRHILLKLSKIKYKEKILKAAREKQ